MIDPYSMELYTTVGESDWEYMFRISLASKVQYNLNCATWLTRTFSTNREYDSVWSGSFGVLQSYYHGTSVLPTGPLWSFRTPTSPRSFIDLHYTIRTLTKVSLNLLGIKALTTSPYRLFLMQHTKMQFIYKRNKTIPSEFQNHVTL